MALYYKALKAKGLKGQALKGLIRPVRALKDP